MSRPPKTSATVGRKVYAATLEGNEQFQATAGPQLRDECLG